MRDAIIYVLKSARYVTDAYLSDLSDPEILIRPVPGAHTIAWQLGHLLLSEALMVNSVRAGYGLTLSPDFISNHSVGNGSEGVDQLSPLALYLQLRFEQRQRTLELIDLVTDSELNEPGPEKMRSYAPTKAAVLLAIGTHEMMHSGQLAVVRRLLGKEVVV